MADIEEYNTDNLNYDEEVPDLGEGGATEEANGGGAEANGGDEAMEDSELEVIKARVRAMEEEAEKLKQMQHEVDKQLSIPTSPSAMPNLSFEEKMEVDSKSVYIGNVDYAATAEELEQHFHGCGSINRVTILCDKFTGHPKGFAYVEFTDKDSVSTAMALDESLFRGRQIKVMPKRTNKPGVSTTNRPPRGRGRGRFPRGGRGGFRGRSGFRGGYRGRANYYSPY